MFQERDNVSRGPAAASSKAVVLRRLWSWQGIEV